jgi:hypothetical protein
MKKQIYKMVQLAPDIKRWNVIDKNNRIVNEKSLDEFTAMRLTLTMNDLIIEK